MIINTWNLRHGGGKRIKDIVRVLSENSRTDIFVLTEYRNNSNKEYLSIELEKLGYKYVEAIDTGNKKGAWQSAKVHWHKLEQDALL